MKYVWITQHRDSFPVARAPPRSGGRCHVLRVSTSGYYASLDRAPSRRAQRHERIQQAVQQVHAESYGIYGSRKIADRLQTRDDLESACRNTVACAMQELSLASHVVTAFKPTTTQADPTKQPAPNHLAQDFTADAPHRKWVTDITDLPTAAGWVYLAVVIPSAFTKLSTTCHPTNTKPFTPRPKRRKTISRRYPPILGLPGQRRYAHRGQ